MIDGKKPDEIIIWGDCLGPTVKFFIGSVQVEWHNPPREYTKNLRVKPLVNEWLEMDALYYLLGKSIFNHLLHDRGARDGPS